MKIKSILNSIVEEINQEQDVTNITKCFCQRINESKIKEEDKKKMLAGIKTKTTRIEAIKYIYNCLLKYEGDGVIR